MRAASPSERLPDANNDRGKITQGGDDRQAAQGADPVRKRFTHQGAVLFIDLQPLRLQRVLGGGPQQDELDIQVAREHFHRNKKKKQDGDASK